VLLSYLRVIVLPLAVALTIAPALSPVASWFRGAVATSSGRPLRSPC
jgi:predicted PurR-regulated permease PerM